MRYDHLTLLPYRAFTKLAKRMTYEGGGKGDAPDTPDFAAAAKETAAGNLEAAKVAAAANRVNQVTPYGNLTYSKNANGAVFDEAGYNAALAAYQKRLSTPQTTTAASGLDSFRALNGYSPNSSGSGQQIVAPTREQFMTGGSPYDSYTATQTLSPAEQAKLNKNNALSLGLLDTAQTGLSGVNDYLKQGFDWSKLPEAQINAGQTAQDAIMARLDPKFTQSEDALRTRLVNQGVRPGSQAWDNEFQNFNQGKNDAYSQAALQGIDVGQKARQQAIQEQEFGRTEGLNIVNALRTGNQVQSPNFINAPQQATTAGADLLGAAQAQYNGDVSSNNAKNAASAGLFGGLASTAGTLGSAYMMSGGML